MIKKIFLLIIIISVEICTQPLPSHYYKLWQKDSLYYLMTDKALFKFYSHQASGEFYLTKYIEGNFAPYMTIALNNDYLFLKRNDSVDVYNNSSAWDLDYQSTFVPDYNIYEWGGVNGFGPYVFIRNGDYYNLLKVEDGEITPVQDSLFMHPSQQLVFFTYPYVVIWGWVYKYVENYGFYQVAQVDNPNVNSGMTSDTLVRYFYYMNPNFEEISNLYKTVIEEPSFPAFTYEYWGINTPQIHCSLCSGTMIAKQNLYYFTRGQVTVTRNGNLAYLVSASDIFAITDNYIFLLGDTVRYSKWYAGSTFYPFSWTDVTNVKNQTLQPADFTLYQNYPNPFNPVTKIKYQLPLRSEVRLTVYDILGREIKVLVNQEKPAGTYEVQFDGSDLPSGVYFYRMETAKYSAAKKFILIK